MEIGGTVASRQGVNIPAEADAGLRPCPTRTSSALEAGMKMGVDMVAISFVRRPEDVEHLREYTRAPLIAKFEKPQAVERAEEIMKASDCIMVARGDLGIELPIEEVPIVQKKLLALAGALARPAITATQMLDSMVTLEPADARRGRRRRQRDPRRDRRGDALAGDRGRRLPVAIEMMAAIALQAEKSPAVRSLDRGSRAPRRPRPGLHDRPRRARRRAS